MSVRYVCTGGCGGSVSSEEFSGGKNSCAADGCSRFAQPLEKRIVCDSCGVHSKESEEHSCGA